MEAHPAVAKFLEVSPEMQNEWRKSELIQWAYRTSIRNEVSGEVKILFASKVMMDLFLEWMNEDLSADISLLEAA